MSAHVFHEIYLHINWHTKDDQALILAEVESAVYGFIEAQCRASDGVGFHGVGGMNNHIHLAVDIEPTVCISDLVGDIKGASAHEVRWPSGMKALEWQRSFAVVSFGKKNLPWVLDYIARQKEHHTTQNLYERLEWGGGEAAT